MQVNRKVPVLIVGGGPVGLALAADLGWRGARCELIEQTDGTIATPKMNEVNVRTMEFCRRWGIADAVLNCPFPADYPFDVVFVTSMAGYELARLPRPPRGSERPEPYSPMRRQACSQTWFDPILRDFASRQPGVRLSYRRRLDNFAATPDGVIADIVDVDTGQHEQVEADYLVGCDGAGSLVRENLGIPLAGKGTLGHPAHLFFRAPGLLEQCGKALGTFFLAIDRHGLWANIRVIDPANDLWRLMVLDTDGRRTPDTLDRAAILRRAVGRDIDVEWIGASVWTRRSLVAERYGEGRVLLAGDAVHQLSPTGALGMNTGIGDAVDLGWKLAAVQQGWAGADLLASYDAERRPVGLRNVRMATAFYLAHTTGADVAAIEDDSEDGQTLRDRLGPSLLRDVGRMFRTLGLEIGYRYDPSPICVSDGTPPPPDDAEDYIPSARPGGRAPHCWLADGRSTLDLFGRGFVLMRCGDEAPSGTALEQAATARGVPLGIVTVHEPAAAELFETSLMLVRPDGHVAWRGNSEPANATAVIDAVRGARTTIEPPAAYSALHLG